MPLQHGATPACRWQHRTCARKAASSTTPACLRNGGHSSRFNTASSTPNGNTTTHKQASLPCGKRRGNVSGTDRAAGQTTPLNHLAARSTVVHHLRHGRAGGCSKATKPEHASKNTPAAAPSHPQRPSGCWLMPWLQGLPGPGPLGCALCALQRVHVCRVPWLSHTARMITATGWISPQCGWLQLLPLELQTSMAAHAAASISGHCKHHKLGHTSTFKHTGASVHPPTWAPRRSLAAGSRQHVQQLQDLCNATHTEGGMHRQSHS